MLSDSESASEQDPYEGTHTDSDEDYLPENEGPNRLIITSSSDEESVVNDHPTAEIEHQTASNVPQIGKKRLVRRALWKRTIQKTKRVQGEPFVNTYSWYRKTRTTNRQ